MIQKIRVRTFNGPDLLGESVLHDIQTLLGINTIKKIQTTKVYRFDGVTKDKIRLLAEKLLSENINQTYSINKYLIQNTQNVIEIAYKPGVMNPEVGSILKIAHDLSIQPTYVNTSREYGFFGQITKEEAEQITKRLRLFNPLIEFIMHKDDPVSTIPIRMMTDEELLSLSKDTLFLNLEEMKTIQTYFKKIKRDPTDCELETIAQTWSEHCAHKTFKAKLVIDGKTKEPLIARIKQEAFKHNKYIVSAFVDNSGVMDFYDGYALCGKGETHNSPSAIEPYGGAMTGSGGVFRDILGTGQGARVIASTDIFCFAPPDTPASELPPGTLPPEYLLKRVVAGVRDYGNRVGIPTNNGSVHFHKDFRAKPTVLVGAYGLIKKEKAQKGIPKKGDVIITVGGRTGRDGVHGATFSSGEMTDRTISVNASAVQIGNAIEEKRVIDALLEASNNNLIAALQDCGAGGFSSAIGEMAQDIGATIHLEKAPLKYDGLLPWEIWISESQERMIVVVDKKNIKEFSKICKKYNVESAVLGEFDGSKKLRVYYDNELVCELDMNFLHHGLPQRLMKGTKPKTLTTMHLEPKMPTTEKDWTETLQSILSHDNICSKEPIVRLYDHSVQAANDLQPYSGVHLDAPNDAVVIRPLIDKPYGAIFSHGLNPILNKIDPYWGSLWAATEALSNYVAVGGNYKHASLINNYIWPFPDEEALWSLDKSVDAVVDVMKLLKIPVISGKDSLSSTYRGKDGLVIKIPPVLCISVFGKIPDTGKTVTSDFKKEGSVICLVGKLDVEAMGGSVYFDTYNILGDTIPRVDARNLPRMFEAIHQGIQQEKILACHDVSEGGLFVTLFEMCLGGDIGAQITSDGGRLSLRSHDSSEVENRPDYFLFNETAGCFVAEVADKKVAKKLFKNIPHIVLGKTQKRKTIDIRFRNKKLFSADIHSLKKRWKEPMQTLFP